MPQFCFWKSSLVPGIFVLDDVTPFVWLTLIIKNLEKTRKG